VSSPSDRVGQLFSIDHGNGRGSERLVVGRSDINPTVWLIVCFDEFGVFEYREAEAVLKCWDSGANVKKVL